MFGIVWNDLEQIVNQRSKFWIWSSCDWALEDPILRHTVIIFKKSRPKNRFVSITYHFFQQNFVQYFCMHLVYPARLVLSWYLKISWHWSYQRTIWSRQIKSRPSSEGYIDVGDGCWRRNVLGTTLRCWWRFSQISSPTSSISQH